MYSFIARQEDSVIEELIKDTTKIRHLATLLNNLDAIAYLSEVLREYIEMNEGLKRVVSSDNGMRKASIREHADKLNEIIGELLGVLELGNLQALARANYEAYREAKAKKPRVGPLRLLKELRSPDVQLTVGFIVILLKNIAKIIEDEKAFQEP